MPTFRHEIEGSYWHAGTQRREVYALCGYSEEASGSGRHTVDKGEEPCPKCVEIARRRAAEDRR